MTTSPMTAGQTIVTAVGASLPSPPADVATFLDDMLKALGFQALGADIGSPQGGLDCGNSILVQ
jgi:hypothetical protein